MAANQEPVVIQDGKSVEQNANVVCEVDFPTILRSNDVMDPSIEYNMNHRRRGIALIFNNERFYWYLGLPERGGTNADRFSLDKRLRELGFDVHVYDNYKASEVLQIIHEVATSDHSDADCFLCVFLSHGENNHVFAYDAKISLQEITERFRGDKCPSLVGKPKIFIIQACRGDKHDEPVMPKDEVDANQLVVNEVVVDAGTMRTLPAGADFIMCYSVAEGFYSHRETVNGSWYIQDFCTLLENQGSQLEFTEFLTLVNRKVSERSVERCADRNALGKKQVPCFASMLTKKLYFKPKTS
ncbi:caspase-6-like isoform X1 [Hemiscyllium ocellatum]|uniref:caspase-6-like isoform X1 n=1 Tax=Hemiscyllium ocellatum TaxID=170820 RepID=UPI002966F209|nr:caspase-6-like isoform X1 [Hemiscyllium ocellatum]